MKWKKWTQALLITWNSVHLFGNTSEKLLNSDWKALFVSYLGPIYRKAVSSKLVGMSLFAPLLRRSPAGFPNCWPRKSDGKAPVFLKCHRLRNTALPALRAYSAAFPCALLRAEKPRVLAACCLAAVGCWFRPIFLLAALFVGRRASCWSTPVSHIRVPRMHAAGSHVVFLRKSGPVSRSGFSGRLSFGP